MSKLITYSLWIHWKQGDDFNAHIEKSKTVSSALRNWADDFAERQKKLAEIAKALDGVNVDVQADTHMIAFTGRDKRAGQILRRLVEKGLLSKNEES